MKWIFKKKKIIDDIPNAVEFLFNKGYKNAAREITYQFLSNIIELVANDEKHFIIRSSNFSKNTFEITGQITNLFIDQPDHSYQSVQIHIWIKPKLEKITDGSRS